MTDLWPDIEPNKPYEGTGGGIGGYRCTALRQDETAFGHKFAYVIWTGKIPPCVTPDNNGGSTVRTNLLKRVDG